MDFGILSTLVIALSTSAAEPPDASAPRITVTRKADRSQANAAICESMLITLRGQIELYTATHKGSAPDFAKHGWQQLIDERFIVTPPRNPLADAGVCDRIAVVTGAGIKGDAVSPSKAGWVWNDTDDVLYPAGQATAAAQERAAHTPVEAGGEASMSLDAYAKLGAPGHDRAWSSRDMAKMASILEQVVRKNPRDLPRYDSAKTGKLFSRICAVEDLATYKNRRLPIETRLGTSLEYYQSLALILATYAKAAPHGAVSGRDLIELTGHLLRSTVVLLGLVEEIKPQLDPKDPKYRARMQGLERTKDGLATITTRTLQMLGERSAFAAADRKRLLVFVNETFPAIIPHVRPATRVQTVSELKRLSTTEGMQDLGPELAALAEKLQPAIAAAE